MTKKLNRLLIASALSLAAAGSAVAAERVEVGSKAPAIEAQSSSGDSYSSSQVLSGDKRIVLIFFRGSW
ncbi:MAG: hypothetical protein AAF725_15750 [Acidobacteriota bacterium]